MIVSFYIVTWNDCENLVNVLWQARQLADEVVVLHDGPYMDDTELVAKQMGADIIFASDQRYLVAEPLRVKALEFMSGDWILTLDTDELFTSEMMMYMVEILSDAHKEECDHVITFRRNFFTVDDGLAQIRPTNDEIQYRILRRGAFRYIPHYHTHPFDLKKGYETGLLAPHILHNNFCERVGPDGKYRDPRMLEKLGEWEQHGKSIGDTNWPKIFEAVKKDRT